MIVGTVNAGLDAVISVEIVDRQRVSHVLSCIIDTGFGGYLTLPPNIIAEFGLPFLNRANVVLGDGRRVRCDVFGGQVTWMKRTLMISIESAETMPLVGMRLLEGCDLSMRVIPGGAVAITPIP